MTTLRTKSEIHVSCSSIIDSFLCLSDCLSLTRISVVSAALTACTFVKSTVNDNIAVHSKEGIEAMREDIDIIDSSLAFTHDLLRSMLDMESSETESLPDIPYGPDLQTHSRMDQVPVP